MTTAEPKTSALRSDIERVWETENADQKAINFNGIIQASKIPPASKRKMIRSLTLLNVDREEKGDEWYADEVDRLATNCLLKFEGHGVIGLLKR